MKNGLFACLFAALALLPAASWALEPEQARGQITLQALNLGLGGGDTIQVLGFANTQTVLPAAVAEDLAQQLMGLFPSALTLRDAKQLGRLAPMLGDTGQIFDQQWRSLRQNNVDALALFEMTSASQNRASITIILSNRRADQASITNVSLPIDRRQQVLDLAALARSQASVLVDRAKGRGRLVVLPAKSAQTLDPSCGEAVRQSYLAALSSEIGQRINNDDLSLARVDRAALKASDVAIELSLAVAGKASDSMPSMIVTLASDRLGYFSSPAQVAPPAACRAAIAALQQPDEPAKQVTQRADVLTAASCEVAIQSMQRVFKIGDELTFQIQPSCDCWPVLVDYTDLNGTEVIRPQDLVHRLAFEQPLIAAGTTVNVPYSNEPYDAESDAVYEFRLTIEPPTRSNTLGVVCATSRQDAESFSPAGLVKASSSRGFGAALKKVSTTQGQRYFSGTRTYFVE